MPQPSKDALVLSFDLALGRRDLATAREYELFPPRMSTTRNVPVGCVRRAVAVKHNDVLAVVLRPNLVDVEKRQGRARQYLTHHAVTLVAFLPSKKARTRG